VTELAKAVKSALKRPVGEPIDLVLYDKTNHSRKTPQAPYKTVKYPKGKRKFD
jgi:hypothetical protein